MEEGRAKRELESSRRREEEEARKAEALRKKEEDKKRREEILEQYKHKKVQIPLLHLWNIFRLYQLGPLLCSSVITFKTV